MLYVGIDWADEKHNVSITDDSGKKLDSFQIENSQNGVHLLFERVQKFAKEQSRVLFALETSKGLMVSSILNKGFTVYSINPKSVDRYRDRYKVSGPKSDDFDAMVLANILRTDRQNHRPILPDSDLTRHLRILTSQHSKLKRVKTIFSNQLTACLKDYYPVALKLFCKLDQKVTLAFLKTFLTCDIARTVSLKKWCDFLKQHHYPGATKKAEVIFFKLKELQFIVEPFIQDANSQYMLTLVQQLEQLIPQIESLEHKIAVLLSNHSDKSIFTTLPGAGIMLSARMISEFGDNRERYKNASSVQSEAGTAPITESSGNQRFIHFRRACKKSFRDTLQQFAFCSTRESIWAKQRYQKYISSGKKHSHALRCLANAWLEIIFSMWKNHTPYSEQQHLLKYVKEQNLQNYQHDSIYLPV